MNVIDRRQYESERQVGRQHTTRRKPDTDYGPTDELKMVKEQFLYLIRVLSDRALKADGTVPNLPSTVSEPAPNFYLSLFAIV